MFGLSQAVLTGRGIKHQQTFVWGVGNHPAEDIFDFGQLSHQFFLNVQSACGVHDEKVSVSGHGGFGAVPGHCRWIGPFLAFDDVHAQTLGPHLQLVHGPGPEGIGGGKHHFSFGGKPFGQLGDAGGFSGTIDAHHQENGGALFSTGDVPTVLPQAFAKVLGQVVSGFFTGRDRPLAPSRTQRFDQTGAQRRANISSQQRSFDGLKCFFIDLATGQGPKNTGKRGAGLGQS